MFLRTYSPAIDVETNTFTGFIFKAVDFDAGCSVTPVGRICSEVVSDPDCYDVYAVEFDAAHFLFMVDDGRTSREIGKLEHIQLVSANVWSCDNDSNQLQNISFYKPFVNLRNSAAHGHKDPAQFIRSLEFLQDGVRRLNFSFEGERAFSAMPLQFYGEFRTHDYGVERSNEIKDSDLSTLLQMRNHITGFRTLKDAGAGTRNPDALLLISNEERVERCIAEKEQEVLDTARLWIKNNDQMFPLKKVLGILNDARSASNRENMEWVLAQASLLQLPVSVKYTPNYSIEPSPLEQLLSDERFREICRTIHENQYQALVPSFETFFTKLTFTLARPYTNHEMHSRLLEVRSAHAAAAKRNAESLKRMGNRQRERWKFWKLPNWR